MPCVIIGNKKWMSDNRDTVEGMLAAFFEGGEQIKKDPKALKKAAELSAAVYAEKDADYWQKYFKPVTEKDKQGQTVELGGSAVNGMAENVQLFGLDGKTNYFAATYTTFADIVKSQYPALLPSYDPVTEVVDLSYLKELSAKKTVQAKK
jgi:ABC-type nitrate/sulfonate/bicarbonate transport system substrate-binding protein